MSWTESSDTDPYVTEEVIECKKFVMLGPNDIHYVINNTNQSIKPWTFGIGKVARSYSVARDF